MREPSLIVEAQALPIAGIKVTDVIKVKLKRNDFMNAFEIKFSFNKFFKLVSLKSFTKLFCAKNLKRLPTITPIVILQRIGILRINPNIILVLKRIVPDAATLKCDFEFK